MIISLDEPLSRRWVLGIGADDRHGDLLAVRQADEGVIVEALEVKAHDDEEASVRVHGGKIEGRAVVQVDQTIETLRKLLVNGERSPVLRARQDILRDQLYRAVASRPYPADRRGRYVRLLEQLFSKGPEAITGVIFRVTVEAGRGASAPSTPSIARSPAGNQVGVVDLIESGTAGKFRPPTPPKGVPPVPTPKPSPHRGGGEKRQPSETSPTPEGGAVKRQRVAAPADKPAAVQEESGLVLAPSDERRVLIGETPGGSDVYWDPHRPNAPLNNFGILITGDSGAGKTHILKAIIGTIANLGLPVCIFDFKNDYSDTAFADAHSLRVYDIERQGLPFNPLSLIADDRGESKPIRQIHELVGILKRIFGLGSQQEAKLRKAMIAAYENAGIRHDSHHVVADIRAFPSFNDSKTILEEEDKNEALLNRLSPLFDLGLFPEQDGASTTFERLMQDSVVLDLHRLPDDRIKAAVSEFIIVRLHGFVLKGEQPRELRRLLVFDEAWRVKDSERLQELAREGRAFGVGITVGTQFPGDIPENLAGNLETQLLLANQNPDHRKTVVRSLCGATSGPEATRLASQVALLQKHEGFLRNQQHAPYCLIRTLPYYKRSWK